MDLCITIFEWSSVQFQFMRFFTYWATGTFSSLFWKIMSKINRGSIEHYKMSAHTTLPNCFHLHDSLSFFFRRPQVWLLLEQSHFTRFLSHHRINTSCEQKCLSNDQLEAGVESTCFKNQCLQGSIDHFMVACLVA